MVENERVAYIIAEAGVNHNGSLELARKLVDAAFAAGADAVKFQTFKTENLLRKDAPKAEYQMRETDKNETQYEMLKKLELDENMHESLINYCREKGIQFLSTPFDHESLNLLTDKFDLPYIKIPSGELTNGPLLLKAAQTDKPIILSTGMSSLGEIELALAVLAFGYLNQQDSPSLFAFKKAYISNEGHKALQNKVVLLHCTTEYPTLYEDVNLRAMDTLKSAFGLPVGYSDHTLGISVPIAAVARGAKVIEKHFTLDRTLPGPDHQASLQPEELAMMVRCIREVERSLGSPRKFPVENELANMSVARKSIVASKDIRKGEMFSEDNISFKRPGSGMPPINYWDLVGKISDRDYYKDELVKL